MEEQSSESVGVANETIERRHVPKPRTYTRYVLPSNRHPFPVHFDVLRQFVTVTRGGAEGVKAEQVEGQRVPVQAASMNVRFLREIGLLTPTERGRYAPTQDAKRFVNARSVSDDRARPILNALVSSMWFSDVARSAFGSQPIMTEDQFLGELALAAQTDREREDTALRVILDYLVYAGIVVRDERGLSLGSTSGQPAGSPSSETTVSAPEAKTALAAPAEAPGWHIVQTEDFYVKVRSDLAVVKDLELHLAALRKKIQRLRQKEGQPLTEST